MTTPQTRACGLDFGTSNSTLGVVGEGGPQLLPLEAGNLTIPSAIFPGAEKEEALLIDRWPPFFAPPELSHGGQYGSVGLGLAIEAQRRYG